MVWSPFASLAARDANKIIPPFIWRQKGFFTPYPEAGVLPLIFFFFSLPPNKILSAAPACVCNQRDAGCAQSCVPGCIVQAPLQSNHEKLWEVMMFGTPAGSRGSSPNWALPALHAPPRKEVWLIYHFRKLDLFKEMPQAKQPSFAISLKLMTLLQKFWQWELFRQLREFVGSRAGEQPIEIAWQCAPDSKMQQVRHSAKGMSESSSEQGNPRAGVLFLKSDDGSGSLVSSLLKCLNHYYHNNNQDDNDAWELQEGERQAF